MTLCITVLALDPDPLDLIFFNPPPQDLDPDSLIRGMDLDLDTDPSIMKKIKKKKIKIFLFWDSFLNFYL